MQIGILGGTFDPPHMAHLHTAEVAYRQLGLDRVLFMPAGSPWQKSGREVSEPSHRWEMTRLAVAGIDYFHADDREVHRSGWTYTADTLATFPADAELFLILGADAAAGLGTWHRVEEVVARARLVVAPRPGTDLALAGAEAILLDTAPIDLSGTLIRSRVAIGRSIRFLVPDAVWNYVVDQGLYRQTAADSLG